MVEQASSFFEAASAASDLGADRDLQNETRLTHLRTPSLPEVALRGELQQRASSHAMPLSASGGRIDRLSSFFEDAAVNALQPEPQSGPGSSLEDAMLGYWVIGDSSMTSSPACSRARAVSVVLLHLVRLFCLGNGRFEAGITQNFFAGLCPAPRWG